MTYRPRLRTRLSSRRRIAATLKRIARNDQVILSALAVAIGGLAGVGAILFRLTIDAVQWGALGFWGQQMASQAALQPWWRLILAPTLGGLVIGLAIYFFMPNRRPQAVADVIEASALNGGRMPFWNGIKAALISAGSIGVGGSVGREGPVVHLGGMIGSVIARRLHLGRRLTRTLLGCGVAAAVAASFNAPIAGVFFALEVVVGHYALSAFAPIVIAAVVGTLVSRAHYGDFPAFILVQNFEIVSFWEFPAFALLGIASAFAALAFMYAVTMTEDAFERVPRIPAWARPAIAGLVVGLVALAYPQILGVGYEATDAALREAYGFWMLTLLALLKISLSGLCLGAGFGGGVFSPSLYIGAMLGGSFGVLATGVFPELSSGHGAYTVVGMGAVAGAVLGAPISSILMIFELTGDYELTIALMVATAIASILVQQIFGRSIFTWQLERRGVNLRGGQEIGVLRSQSCRSMMDSTYATIAPDAPIAEVRDALMKAPWGELFLIDGAGQLVGTITFGDLSGFAFDTSQDAELTADKLARARPPVLETSEHLERAVQVFSASGESHLAVVDSRQSMKMLGLLHEHEVMSAYHRALVEARKEERGED